jgi:hypothetical protein
MFIWTGAIIPWYKSQNAKGWVQTDCTLLQSDIISRTTRSAIRRRLETERYRAVIYGYEYRGRTYQSNVYGPDGATEIPVQEAFGPPGSKAVCYVNSANPREVCLDRRYRLGQGTPPVLIGIGAIGVGLVLARKVRQKKRNPF